MNSFSLAATSSAIVILIIGISHFYGKGKETFIPIAVMSILLFLQFWSLFNKLGMGK